MLVARLVAVAALAAVSTTTTTTTEALSLHHHVSSCGRGTTTPRKTTATRPWLSVKPRGVCSPHLPPCLALRVADEEETEGAATTEEAARREKTQKSEGGRTTTTSSLDEEAFYLENPFYLDGERPASAASLALSNLARQGATLLAQAGEAAGLVTSDPLRPPEGLRLELSNAAVAEAEKRRERSGGKVEAHPASRFLYDVGCSLLDNLFDERPIARFWFLETVARIPYFSYVSMLHLYESFGWWRAAELRKVHGAEEWNELHHLLIMEALGGNARWSDRFLGYHVAIAYYWALIVLYLFSPRLAYQFMELLEAHAVDTYGTFVNENRERLKKLPPPTVAKSYYLSDDLYYFDDFQVSKEPGVRRPPCDSLFDVFQNICEDEAEHVKTMRACQDYCTAGRRLVSPHLAHSELRKERQGTAAAAAATTKDVVVVVPASGDAGATTTTTSSEGASYQKQGFVEYVQDVVSGGAQGSEANAAKRALWKKWAEAVNEDENADNMLSG